MADVTDKLIRAEDAHDNDLIRRGDALNAIKPIYGWSITAAEGVWDAIAALPAQGVKPFNWVGGYADCYHAHCNDLADGLQFCTACGAVRSAALEPAEAGGVEAWPTSDEVSDAADGGKGFWRSCSGCHETNEGHPTGPFNRVLNCHVGFGCHECGGLGAVWDTTDYADMGEYLAKHDATPAPVDALVKAAEALGKAREILIRHGYPEKSILIGYLDTALAAIREGHEQR
jgi:hypothetical protein